jgi:hypothetical protein
MRRKQIRITNAALVPVTQHFLTHEEIQHCAYAIYLARGVTDGHDLDDWLQAERDLLDNHYFPTPLADPVLVLRGILPCLPVNDFVESNLAPIQE